MDYGQDIRIMRENQVKLQTQFENVLSSIHSLNQQISGLIVKMEKHNDKLDSKVDLVEEKLKTELKNYVQKSEIQNLQKIIYGGIGTVLTFVLLAVLAVILPT